MEVFFPKGTYAIQRANESKSYGCFYSEKNDANENIHMHECCEILFCISGGKTFFIDDRIYEVEDGDIFVLNQFEAHKITSEPAHEFKRYVMQIHPAFLYEASSSETDLSRCFSVRGDNVSHRISLLAEEAEKIENLFKKMSVDHGFGDDILKNNAAVEILTLVNRHFIDKNRRYTYHSDYENETIVRVFKFINESFSESLSLEIVAKNCFISINELCRLFKKHTGTTVTKYILSRRITEAKKLLKSGESVSAAAEKCGFCDYASFIRAFKRAVGTSPGKYKKADLM